MNVQRAFHATVLALSLLATVLPASAAGVFGPHGHGHGPWFGAPALVGSGFHGEGHRHRHGKHDRWRHDWRRHGHRHGHRHGRGKGASTLYTLEHRHGGSGWHVHREWRRERHRAPPQHGPRRNDDWEDGAGIALGLLAGMLLLNQFADGAGAAPAPARPGGYPRILDSYSQQRQAEAIRNALDAGGNSVATWANPANRGGGASGEVRITRSGRDEFGNPCREYRQTVRVGNRSEQGHRVACRDRNGNWHLQPGP